MPRQILRNAGLYLVPVIDPPVILYEESGKTRRKRADVIIYTRLVNNAAYASVLAPNEPIAVPIVTESPDISVQVSGI